MIIFTQPECKNCAYIKYELELNRFKEYLEDEPVPNCDRDRCLIDNKDITRFINNGWVIKYKKSELKRL